MDDDWDDGSAPATDTMKSASSLVSEGGRKFTHGRGFAVVNATTDDWGSNSNTEFADSGWNETQTSDNFQHNRGTYDNGGRDRGGPRGRRGGRGGKNFSSDFSNDSGCGKNGNKDWGADANKEDGWGDSGDMNHRDGDNDRRGRGGRGGSRGRGRGHGSGFSESNDGLKSKTDDNKDEKPREIYIPVERTPDEELFTSTITSGINFIKLDEIEVNVSGEDVPCPMQSFESSGLRPHILDNVKKSGYSKPTPIQKHAIPIIMQKRDLMGCAQTGSGKTVGFYRDYNFKVILKICIVL